MASSSRSGKSQSGGAVASSPSVAASLPSMPSDSSPWLIAAPFALLLIPLLLLKMVIRAAVLLLVLPFVLLAVVLGLGVAFFAVALALLTPLLPFAAIAFVIWMIVRASQPSYAR